MELGVYPNPAAEFNCLGCGTPEGLAHEAICPTGRANELHVSFQRRAFEAGRLDAERRERHFLKAFKS